MTSRNVERTGKRKLTRTSQVARGIRGVRHLDQDLFQWCPDCKRPELFVEVKSVPVSKSEWDMTRRFADYFQHNCLALLVVEAWYGDLGVQIYDGETISDLHWSDTEDYLISVMERARDSHVCW
jgi:hypothetical protein